MAVVAGLKGGRLKNEAQFFQLYGLRTASFVPLPEVPVWPGGIISDADVQIVLEDMPPKVMQAIQARGDAWIDIIDETDFWFTCTGGHFYITGGNRILVDTSVAESSSDTRQFLLGSAFGLLLIQRGLMPVHGGSVIAGGKAVIIGGDTGAGKSTITSTLLQKPGIRFLADDVSVLQVRADGVWVLPAYPQRKLCQDAALALGYDLSNLEVLPDEREKYAVRSTQGWHGQPARLGAIVEIVPDENCTGVSLHRVQGHGSLELVIRNLYRSFAHFMLGMKPDQMKRCLAIASQVPVYQLQRPVGVDTTDAVAQQVLNLL